MKKAPLLFVLSFLCKINSNAQNVGVGTTTPETILHIAETKTATDGADGVFVNIQNTTPLATSGSLTGIRFRMDGVGTPVNSRYKGGLFFQKTGSFGVGTLHFLTNNTASNTSVSMADARMSITSLGEVGIGTTVPGHKMHVTGGDFFLESTTGAFRYGNNGGDQWGLGTLGGGQNLLFRTSPDGTTFTTQHQFAQNGNVGFGTGSTTPAARLHVSTTSSEVARLNGTNPYLSFHDNTDGYKGYLWYDGTNMVLGAVATNIRLSGNVVLGSAPAVGYRLSVDGKAIFEEARVQLSTAWPDYVFAHDYKLLSLGELERSIARHKHLPNMPAASEVEKNGFDLGDMNKRLVEKVEELTLYIIDLDKKKNALEARLDILEKMMAEKK